MRYGVRLHPEVVAELDEAFQWYEQRSPGLGEKFIAAVSEKLDAIAAMPLPESIDVGVPLCSH